jgi:hypothetical protein
MSSETDAIEDNKILESNEKESKEKESKEKDKEKVEECIELKNINYKNMLLTGNTLSDLTTNYHTSMDNLDKFLKEENMNNKNEQWCKLNKTSKIEKLILYANACKETKGWTEEDVKVSIEFFKKCLDRKKLQRVKDVSYDKEKGAIKDIPLLIYDKVNKHFTLRNTDKHVSTLKCLTPKNIEKEKTDKNKTDNNKTDKKDKTDKKEKKTYTLKSKVVKEKSVDVESDEEREGLDLE